MIPLLIFGGWALLVACACAIGANKHLAEVTEIASGLRGDIRKALREKELAREKTSMLLQYVDSDREYRTFDDVLRGLPKGDYHGNPHQYRIMEAKRFDLAAFHAISEPCTDSMTVTALSFDATRIHFYGREYTGWERRGWVMVPREAFDR